MNPHNKNQHTDLTTNDCLKQKYAHILTHQVFEHCFLMSQKMVNDGSPTKAQYGSLVASKTN